MECQGDSVILRRLSIYKVFKFFFQVRSKYMNMYLDIHLLILSPFSLNVPCSRSFHFVSLQGDTFYTVPETNEKDMDLQVTKSPL